MAKRYQRGNQNPYIEEQTIQWPKDTKGVIRIRISKNKQHNRQKIPKGGNQNPYIEEEHNGQNNDLQNNIHKTKDRVTRTPLKTGDELRCSGTVSSTCSTSSRVNLVTNPVISHERGKDREVFTTSGTYPWSFVISLQSTVLCIHISCLVYVRTEKLWSNKKVISSLAQIKYNTYRLNVIWFHDVIKPCCSQIYVAAMYVYNVWWFPS